MASDDLLRLIAAGPSGGGEEPVQGRAKPIGVPETFMPYVQQPSGPISADAAERRGPAVAREPYYDGAEYGPRSLSPETRARMQAAMAQAGLIGKRDTYRLGVWDETSVKAYKKVLAYANQGGLDADTALSELLQAPQYDAEGLEAGGAGALQPDPGKVTATTSALSLEEQVQQTARQRLGRKLRANEVSKFVTLFQGMEGGFNDTAASMQETAAVTGQDASIEEIPTADVAAEQFVDADYAQEAAGQDAYGYLNALRGLIGGS